MALLQIFLYAVGMTPVFYFFERNFFFLILPKFWSQTKYRKEQFVSYYFTINTCASILYIF